MSKFLVGIDAGHGMNTSGKQTPYLPSDLYINGKLVRKKGQIIKENEWNRGVAEYLEKALKRCKIDTIFLSDRSGKVDTPLDTRIKRANNAKCDIVVSHHYNAFGMCAGFIDRKGGLLVLRTENASQKSIKLGTLVAKQLESDIKFAYSYGLRKDEDISGYTLAILRQTKMPAILIEYGFMDVLREAKLMLDTSYQKKCAESVCKAICDYFNIGYIKEVKQLYAIRNIHDKPLNVRDTADWDGKVVGELEPNHSLTYVDTVSAKNGSTKMYKTKLGTYVTASDKYTKLIKL